MSTTKRNALLFLSAASILLMLLAMSLSSLTLAPGNSFSLGKSDVSMPGVAGEVSHKQMFAWILRGLIALAFLVIFAYIIYSLFSAKGRRRLVQNLIAAVILFFIADYLYHHPFSTEPDEGTMEMALDDFEDESVDESSEIFSAGRAPGWLVVVVILVASGMGVALLVAILPFVQKRPTQKKTLLNPLAEAAQDTLDILRAGGDFKTAIIRCYQEMTRVVKEERGITRERTMTPREFETYLVSRGLPQKALETLTRLFEQVRYGSVPPRTDDETMAFACLTEIVDTCKAEQPIS